MNLTVTITGDKEELARFRKLGDKLTDFTAAMRTTGSELKTYYSKEVFASEGGVLGQKWADLSPIYRRYKGKHYPGRGINIASGKTQKSFVADTNRNTAIISNSNREIFGYLQLGTRRMPARPMLAVNKDVEEIVQHIIEDDVKTKLAATT